MPTTPITPEQLAQYVTKTTTGILLDLADAGLDAAQLRAAGIVIEVHVHDLAMDLVIGLTVFDEDEEE